MATRVYVVNDTEKPALPPRLIRATYKHVAERHVAQRRFVARIATKDDLENLITSGVRVEHVEEQRDDVTGDMFTQEREATT